MYVNKCTKCGAEFETKNPKRVICPNCLYPDRKPLLDDESGNDNSESNQQEKQQLNYYSTAEDEEQQPRRDYDRPQGYNQDRGGYNQNRGGYNQDRGGYSQNRGGYNQDRGGYNRQGGGYNQNRGGYSQNRGGYNQDRGGYNRQGGGYNRPQSGGYNRPQGGGYNRPQSGGYNRSQGGGHGRPQGGGFRPQRRPAPQKTLLVSKEQVAQIEEIYKKLLPLPNYDAHEVIGAQIDLEPKKVFFAINLIRQKMFLPKLPFPKRKLAVSPDQLQAIKNLYEPLLPLPPIGCHKIIATQLRMDEWRVHVGIGIVRKQMGLDRWNEGRPDAPPVVKKEVPAEEVKEAHVVEETPVEEVKPKRGRKKKTEEAE